MRTQKHRRDWGESAAILLCAVLFLALQDRYTIGSQVVSFAFGVATAVGFLLSIVWTIAGDRRAARIGMTVTAMVLTGGVISALAKVIYLVIFHAKDIQGIPLIETGLAIWVGNVVVFAILYQLAGERQFLFPQPPDTAPRPQRRPQRWFADYIFLAFTTATAFSPTDTPPLTTQARMLVMTESVVSLLTISVVAARAVNILQ